MDFIIIVVYNEKIHFYTVWFVKPTYKPTLLRGKERNHKNEVDDYIEEARKHDIDKIISNPGTKCPFLMFVGLNPRRFQMKQNISV